MDQLGFDTSEERSDSPKCIYRQQYLDIRSHSPFHSPIFTDGLNVENGVTAAIGYWAATLWIRIPKRCSIFIAEARL